MKITKRFIIALLATAILFWFLNLALVARGDDGFIHLPTPMVEVQR